MPSFVLYNQHGKMGVSCSLITSQQKVDVISYDEKDKDDDDFPFCMEGFPPIVLSLNGSVYAIYRYFFQEIRGVISEEYVTVDINGSGFRVCDNSDEISGRLLKLQKVKLSQVNHLKMKDVEKVLNNAVCR